MLTNWRFAMFNCLTMINDDYCYTTRDSPQHFVHPGHWRFWCVAWHVGTTSHIRSLWMNGASNPLNDHWVGSGVNLNLGSVRGGQQATSSYARFLTPKIISVIGPPGLIDSIWAYEIWAFEEWGKLLLVVDVHRCFSYWGSHDVGCPGAQQQLVDVELRSRW